MKRSIYLIMFCSAGILGIATAQTNTLPPIISWESFDENLFLTDNDQVVVMDPVSKRPGFYAQTLIEARKSVESRPASEDPKGNWGVANAGFQLSLRFSQAIYASNQPITAIVILRNVSQESLRWSPDWKREKLSFLIEGPNGRQTTPITDIPAVVTSGPTWLTVHPKTQRRYELNLGDKFDLRTPGKYLVLVQTEVQGTNAGVYSSISSAQATIEVGNPVQPDVPNQK